MQSVHEFVALKDLWSRQTHRCGEDLDSRSGEERARGYLRNMTLVKLGLC